MSDITTSSLRHLFALIFMYVILGIVIFYFSLFGTRSSTTVQLETLSERMLYSGDGFIYTDESGRSYPGIIDLNKFTTERLESAIDYTSENPPSAELILERKLGICDEFLAPCDEIYLNEKQYGRMLPLAHQSLTGSGKVKMLQKKIPVLYYDGNDFYEGRLKMTLLAVKT